MEQSNRHIILHIQKLRVFQNNKVILKNINMDIREHEVVALVGPAGHGKSILPRAINQLFPTSHHYKIKGNVLLNNKSTNTIPTKKLRQNIGMLFSAPNLFPMSIYENIAFGLRIKGISSQKELDNIIKNALLEVNLWENLHKKLNQSINTLTTEQQQLLCLARIVALKPQIILMDKPTSTLNSSAKSRFEDLIFDLKQKYTIIVVAADKQQAGRISDRIAFFYNGRLVEYGQTKNIFTHPKEQLTEKYITGRII